MSLFWEYKENTGSLPIPLWLYFDILHVQFSHPKAYNRKQQKKNFISLWSRDETRGWTKGSLTFSEGGPCLSKKSHDWAFILIIPHYLFFSFVGRTWKLNPLFFLFLLSVTNSKCLLAFRILWRRKRGWRIGLNTC